MLQLTGENRYSRFSEIESEMSILDPKMTDDGSLSNVFFQAENRISSPLAPNAVAGPPPHF
jgi:hypothetical protein